MSCRHPKTKRTEPKRPGKDAIYYCEQCERDVRPAGFHARPALIRHGTAPGYDKHRRIDSGNWKMPACEPCMAARREYLREYRTRIAYGPKAKERDQAKNRALTRLRRSHPGEYAKYYAEELGLIRASVVSAVEQMQAEVAELLAGHQAGLRADPWADLNAAVKNNWATTEERERWRRIVTLRSRIAQEQERAEEAQVTGGHRQ